MNICDWIDQWSAETPGKCALIFEGQSFTYLEVAHEVREYSARLRHSFGIKRGDRVAYLGLNSPGFLFLIFACARIGALIAPLNWRLAQVELKTLVKDAEPRLLIADRSMQAGWTDDPEFNDCEFVSMSHDCADGWKYFFAESVNSETGTPKDCAEDPLLLVYTSGTTGAPKGALLAHNALLANAINSQAMHQLSAEDLSLVSLPFFHVGGLNILTTPTLFVGGTVILQRTFEPQAMLAAMMNEKPTRVPIVSAQMPPILNLPGWQEARFPLLKSVTTGASPVSPVVYSSWQEKGIAVLQVYGATETCPIAINTNLGEELPGIGTAGRAAAGCKVKIVDDDAREVAQGQAGEILISGDNVMSSYWRNQSATAAALRDGWYLSGDIGYQDKEGYYYIVDRKKDMIISGGENIYPAEIEALLMQHEGIAEAAVIARPDERWGEVPIAAVLCKEKHDLSENEILTSLEGRLGRYKIPKAVVFVTDFPRNSVGKIQKFILRNSLFRE